MKPIVMLTALLSLLLAGSSSVLLVAEAQFPTHLVMPWLCLDYCSFTQEETIEHILDIKKHNDAFFDKHGVQMVNAVSFEGYRASANSTLTFAAVLDANYLLKQYLPNVSRIVMMACTSIDDMRSVFSNPEPLISALVEDLVIRDIDGVDIDFEPTDPTTSEDGIAYAAFLEKVKWELARRGKILAADIATWSNIWNYSAIAKAVEPMTNASRRGYTAVESTYAVTMNTYVYNRDDFVTELAWTTSEFGISNTTTLPSSLMGRRLAIGLDNGQITDAEITQHFEVLQENKLCQIAIWDMPISSLLWDAMENLTANCINSAPRFTQQICTSDQCEGRGCETHTYVQGMCYPAPGGAKGGASSFKGSCSDGTLNLVQYFNSSDCTGNSFQSTSEPLDTCKMVNPWSFMKNTCQ